MTASAIAPGGEARAEGPAGLVLEVYGGSRPAAADAFMRPVLAELESRGYAAGPFAARKAIEGRSRAARGPAPVAVDDLREQIGGGYRMFLRGDYGAAIAALDGALRTIRDNPAIVAGDQTMLPFYQRALIGLSLARRRAGRESEAAETMAELVRTFPTAEISRAEYGPEPVDFFRAVSAKLAEAGSGRLIVEASEKSAVLFVNERYTGIGQIAETLPRGRYRIFARQGQSEGRVYEVAVEKGRDTRLVIDWNLDSAIQTTARWTGLLLPAGDRVEERAVDYAARLGREIGAGRVVLVGIRQRSGETSLVGMVVGVDGAKILRQAELSLDERDPPTTLLAALGRFLAGDEADPRLDVVVDQVASSRPRAEPRRSTGPWKWAALGGAAVAVGTGALLLWADGNCKGDPPAPGAECRTLWSTSVAGWTGVGVGAVLGAAAGYLFWRERHNSGERALRAGLAPGRGGVGVWASFDF